MQASHKFSMLAFCSESEYECKHNLGKDACMATDEPSGRAKGGVARAEALSPAERQSIAKKAAGARWGKKPLQATHKGSFEKDFGIDVECYVLNDEQKTAVISQRGMGEALGLGSGGSRLPMFIRGEKIAPFIGHELSEKLENPIIFQWSGAGTNSPIHGYDVTILIDICKAILQAEAEGKLLKRQEHIAKQAHIIVNASAKAGIKGLVYALSGYDVTREEVIAAFKLYVQEEARTYEKEFPPKLYEHWYRLYDIPTPAAGKPWHFKHLTIRHIYYPLAKSNGKILELLRALKALGGDRRKKLFQFLNDLGGKALTLHLGRVLEMAESSSDQYAYERKIVERFGGQQELDLVMPSSPTASPPPS